MGAADRHVVAKVKNIVGEVIAISPDGSKRVLMAGDFIYADETIDTSKGKVFLVQDGDIVLQTDIAAILGQGELSPEEKAKIDKILKDLESEDKDQLMAASGEAGQEKHEPPVYIPHDSREDPGVRSKAQVLISFGAPSEGEKTFFIDETPEQVGTQQVGVISPIELTATTLNQLPDPFNANFVGDYFGVLAQNNNIVKQNLNLAFDTLIESHPDAVFAISVTGSLADYLVAPLEFPAPIILPFGLGMQPWKVVTGDAPNSISYLYRKEDLNLLKAMDSKQELIDSADQQIQYIHEVKNTIEEQISGISNLSLDKFEIKSNLNAEFVFFDNLKNQLLIENVQLNNQKVIAEANLAVWEGTVHNFGIPLGSISNSAAISSLEASWKILGGTSATIPGLLESLYADRAIFEGDINHLDTQILANQTLINSIVQDIITPLLLLTNYDPIDDADYKQALMKASLELEKQDILAQGYKNALLNSLEAFDLVLRTGLTNDADFGFKTQVLLVDSLLSINPFIVGDLFDQNGGLVNVDALASGIKVELNGQLTTDQILTLSSQFDPVSTKLIFNLDLKFANPSADENIHIEFPGVPGLNLSVTTLNFPFVVFDPNVDQTGKWVLHPDNSITLDLPSASPNYVSRSSIVDTLELSFPTALLKNVELNNFIFKILINSQVIPVGDNEANLNNNILNQAFSFDILGKLPGRGIYFVESISQADALANVEKHAVINIKPLLENISFYLDILSGPSETNFLNNTRIEFKFFNVDPAEPPKVLLSDGVAHTYDFVKIGDSWVLTGQALSDYINAWETAKLANNAAEILKLEQPYIIAAPYGADDMSVKVFGLINGSNEVIIQPIVPIIIDAVAQGIIADDVDLSNVNFNLDFTKFKLMVNIEAPDGDGSEARLIDINLTNVFNYTSEVPAGFDPQWTVFSNDGVWKIDTVSVPGEVHLRAILQGDSNTTFSDLILGFSSETLKYLTQNGNYKYEIVIGGSTFDVPGTNPAGVISTEILGQNEKDFNLTDDQIGPAYLAAGSTIVVPVFQKITGLTPATFTDQDDYYFVSDPGSFLTVTRMLWDNKIESGTNVYFIPNPFPSDLDNTYLGVQYTTNDNPLALLSMSALFARSDFNVNGQPFPYVLNLTDQHINSNDFLLPGDPNTDPAGHYVYLSFNMTFTYNFFGEINSRTINYSYRLNGTTSHTEYGVGRFFEPGGGDDIVIGSYGRDIFKCSQVDFVGNTNTTSNEDLGNDIFFGGLGRDWIETGAGEDIVYSDGTPAANDGYSLNYVDFAPVFLSSSIGSGSIYLPKITDVIATGAGDDIIYTGGSNYSTLFGTGGPSISGHDAVGITGKDAGVLVFAGPGNNIIFSGRGADIIVLDDTLGITRIVPTTSGFVVPSDFNLQDGLHYVYSADVEGGNYGSLFTGSGDTSTFTSVQTLIANPELSVVADYEIGLDSIIQNSYLYDIIRPIYSSVSDGSLTNATATTGTGSAFRTAEHGSNTLVYWKDSLSADANSADVVMYFDVNSDKINLTALFNELNPTMTEQERWDAIQLTTITSVTPFDSTSSSFGTATYDPFSTDGREGTRVSVSILDQQSNTLKTYVVADLASVHNADITLAIKQSMFEVVAAPDAQFP